MAKKNNSEIVSSVATGLSTLWTSYKRTAARRHQPPMTSFINDLFGVQMNDADAARYLARDIAEIRDTLSTKKNEKRFYYTIKN